MHLSCSPKGNQMAPLQGAAKTMLISAPEQQFWQCLYRKEG